MTPSTGATGIRIAGRAGFVRRGGYQAGTDTLWRAGYPMEGPIVFEAEVLETRL